jgi:hypothetical protein
LGTSEGGTRSRLIKESRRDAGLGILRWPLRVISAKVETP